LANRSFLTLHMLMYSFTVEYNIMIKKRDVAWKKYIQFKSTANFDHYKNIRNTVNSMVRADSAAHRKSLLDSWIKITWLVLFNMALLKPVPVSQIYSNR